MLLNATFRARIRHSVLSRPERALQHAMVWME